jgi:flagellar hook-associated protein 3 FlgL
MDRVTTFLSSQSAMMNLMAAETRQNDAQQQVSTGFVATDLKGYGHQAEALTAANTLKTRVDGFVTGAKALSSKLDAQNLALGQVSDAAQGAHDAIANAIATGHADGLMSALQSFFGQAAQGLNTQFDGQYLFAGAQTSTAPVAISDMTQLPTATASDMFKNDQLKPVSQVDESTTLQTGFLASDVGGATFDAFKQVQAFADGANGPFSGQLTEAQTTFLKGMLSSFSGAASGAVDVTAQNGLLQNRVDQVTKTQTDRQSMLQTMIGGITDVDVADAVSRLTQAQTAVQASAQVFASLQNTSLLNYLK